MSKKDKIKELITSLSEANIRLAFELMDGQDISDEEKLRICKDVFLKISKDKSSIQYIELSGFEMQQLRESIQKEYEKENLQ